MASKAVEAMNAARKKKREAGELHNDGRPTKYKAAYAKMARKLCEAGALDVELADFFEIDIANLYRWRLRYKEFREATTIAKAAADERVERSLFTKANGYTFESEKIFQFQGEIIRAKTREHVPPSDTAMSLWLRNRKPKAWRDKTEEEIEITHKFEDLDDAQLERAVKARQDRISGASS